MIGVLIHWLISTLAILAVSYVLPGVHVDSFMAALVAALVLGIINALVKPVLFVLTLPITLLTLGLFTFVLNALLVLAASAIVPGFKIDGFLWALVFSFVYSLVGSFFHKLSR